MTTKSEVFQLNLGESEDARMSLLSYVIEQGKSYSESLDLSSALKSPVDTLIGQLLLYLQNLPACASNEQEQIFWRSSSFEAWMGIHWLVKKEWIARYKFPVPLKGAKGIAKAKKDTEQTGYLFQMLLHLCQESATIAHFGQYSKPVGDVRLFSAIVMEMVLYGGLFNLLPMVYYLNGSHGSSKKERCRQLVPIVSRIQSLESPNNDELFIGKLLAHAVRRAEQDELYKNIILKPFLVALRAYFTAINSEQCGLVSFNQSSDWVISLGKSKGYKKLVSVPLSP